MSNNRQPSNVLKYIPTSLEIMEKLKIALVKIHDVFTNVLIVDKQKPTENEKHFLLILNEFKDYLETNVPPFDSVIDLNKYYQQMENNIDVYINDYCHRKHLNVDKISANKRIFFLQYVKIYHALVQERFLLSLFYADESLDPLLNRINKLVHECLIYRSLASSHPSLSEMQNLDETFDEIIHVAVATPQEKGYPRDIDVQISKNEFKENNNLFLLELNKQFMQLPIADKLNEVIDDIKTAFINDNDRELKLKQDLLKYHEQTLEDIKNKIQRIKSAHFVYFNDLITRMLNDSNKIKNILDKKFELLEITELLKILVGDHQYDQLCVQSACLRLKTNISQRQSSPNLQLLKDMTLGWLSTNDKSAAEFTNILVEIADDTNRFIDEHKNQYKRLDEYVQQLKADKQLLDNNCMVIAGKLPKIENALSICVSSIERAQVILQSYTKLTVNDLKNFLVHHWLKMLLGGVLLGSSGSALALLLALPALKFGVLATAATIVGTTVGAGTGVAVDEFTIKNTASSNARVNNTWSWRPNWFWQTPKRTEPLCDHATPRPS